MALVQRRGGCPDADSERASDEEHVSAQPTARVYDRCLHAAGESSEGGGPGGGRAWRGREQGEAEEKGALGGAAKGHGLGAEEGRLHRC